MPIAKKLPSGSWRVQVYSHTDIDGKKHYESFTGSNKREAELLASEWSNNRKKKNNADLTVSAAISGYINAKVNVLSPSTIRGYRKMERNNYHAIEHKAIKKLTTEDLQLFVSDLAQELSPKTVANIYALLSSALSFYMPDTAFRVTLPHKKKKKVYAPPNEDVQTLFREASPELQKCIALGAYGGLRRGEISALTFADLKDNILNVDKDMIQCNNGEWILKDIPKTDESCRLVPLPQKVVDLLGHGEPSDRIISYQNPGSITQCFTKLRNRLGIDIRFHDLRHFYASIGAVLGIPDNSLAEFGGWSRGSNIMKATYQNTIKSMNDVYAERMRKYFNDMI